MKRKKKQGIEIDARDPNAWLWTWLLAVSWQRPAVREAHSKVAKQRDAEYWENHSAAVADNHRKLREAWLTDEQTLLTSGTDSP